MGTLDDVAQPKSLRQRGHSARKPGASAQHHKLPGTRQIHNRRPSPAVS
jgi:hypothetical protein